MIEKIKNCKYLFLCVIILTLNLVSCATSMSPTQVHNTLPTLTKSQFVSSIVGQNNRLNANCTVLQTGRIYNAPMGLSAKHDLRNGAKGIDEWVELDGGNSYRLKNYQWVAVGDLGSTQLQIEFDTMICGDGE